MGKLCEFLELDVVEEGRRRIRDLGLRWKKLVGFLLRAAGGFELKSLLALF